MSVELKLWPTHFFESCNDGNVGNDDDDDDDDNDDGSSNECRSPLNNEMDNKRRTFNLSKDDA